MRWRGVRYTRQYDKYTCGPTLVLNVMKWAGIQATRKDLKILKRACEAVPLSGTTRSRLEHVLRRTLVGKAHYNKVKKPDLATIRNHLNRGGVVGLQYLFKRTDRRGRDYWNGHYNLVVHCTRSENFIVVNDNEKTITTMSVLELLFCLWEKDDKGRPVDNCAFLFLKGDRPRRRGTRSRSPQCQ
jgi:hypothetical protein